MKLLILEIQNKNVDISYNNLFYDFIITKKEFTMFKFKKIEKTTELKEVFDYEIEGTELLVRETFINKELKDLKFSCSDKDFLPIFLEEKIKNTETYKDVIKRKVEIEDKKDIENYYLYYRYRGDNLLFDENKNIVGLTYIFGNSLYHLYEKETENGYQNLLNLKKELEKEDFVLKVEFRELYSFETYDFFDDQNCISGLTVSLNDEESNRLWESVKGAEFPTCEFKSLIKLEKVGNYKLYSESVYKALMEFKSDFGE